MQEKGECKDEKSARMRRVREKEDQKEESLISGSTKLPDKTNEVSNIPT